MRQVLIRFVHDRAAAIIERFFPDLNLCGCIAGHRFSFMDVADLAAVLGHLHRLGIVEIAGHEIPAALRHLLRQIDGPATNTFYSYRVAETLQVLSGLGGFTPAEQDNLRHAIDSTEIYDREKKELRGYPNNYWAVLARCELGRQRLGLLADDALLNESLARVRQLLTRNPLGFFDDSRELTGRYDIYSADTLLFLLPLREQLGTAVFDPLLRRHVELLETIALENGAFYAYGRSIGALSVCLTMELGALAVREGLTRDPDRLRGLVANAFAKFQDWWSADLVNAHRGAMTEGYRGQHRLLQMSLDLLIKVAFVAEQLDETPAGPPVFPATDTYVRFDERGAGLWMFRNEYFAFQLPVVDGSNADYGAWLHSPGLFENPVESPLICGVPRSWHAGKATSVTGLPTAVTKGPGSLTLTWPNRTVTFRVAGDEVVAEEHWRFTELPEAISFAIPESRRPLTLQIESGCRYHQHIVDVTGMSAWRSCWGELRRVREVNFVPAREIRFTWRLRPVLRVTNTPGDHDYNRALYDQMPVVERRLAHGRCPNDMTVAAIVGDSEVLHIGWPEHLFAPHGLAEAEFDRRYLAFVADLGRSGVKIVWTMHNRRPHTWAPARGRQLYRAWAAIADGVIHHSRWGLELMRTELPFKATARHVVIPHGHFGAQMPAQKTRADLEQEYGLPPCALRFGVLGRPQKEKQVDLIVRAFMMAARPDQQLFVTAHPIATDVSADPRVILAPREQWLTRASIAGHVQVCDALVSAHTGDTYLTSGTFADAIGAGIPMVANEWEFFREMLGDAAFYHDNTEAGLAQLFARLTGADIARGKAAFRALQPRFAWPGLAAQTLAVLRAVVAPLNNR